MPRYVDADKLFVGKHLSHKLTVEDAAFVQEILDVINKAPGEDVEPVRHGRWIMEQHAFSVGDTKVTGRYPTCTRCGSFVTGYEQFGAQYCPKCGAKMDEADP